MLKEESRLNGSGTFRGYRLGHCTSSENQLDGEFSCCQSSTVKMHYFLDLTD